MTDAADAADDAAPGAGEPVAAEPAERSTPEPVAAEPSKPAESPADDHDEELSRRLQARTEELFGTGAIPIQQTPTTGPTTADVRWAEPEPVRTGLGGSALAFAIAALGGSFVVAWMFPLGVFALILGIIAVRRPAESSRLGWWAIGLSLLSLVYSAGWAWWVGRGFGWWA